MKRIPKGRLELTWMGKDSTLIPVEDGKYDHSWVDPTDPRALEVKNIETVSQIGQSDGPSGASENLLVIGDSGDALRSLGTIPVYAERFAGQVKLVYIDPPFNTEKTFEHYADQLEHSIWLTMMRDRIRDIRPLLSPDASIWVHLDDSEVHRMRIPNWDVNCSSFWMLIYPTVITGVAVRGVAGILGLWMIVWPDSIMPAT